MRQLRAEWDAVVTDRSPRDHAAADQAKITSERRSIVLAVSKDVTVSDERLVAIAEVVTEDWRGPGTVVDVPAHEGENPFHVQMVGVGVLGLLQANSYPHEPGEDCGPGDHPPRPTLRWSVVSAPHKRRFDGLDLTMIECEVEETEAGRVITVGAGDTDSEWGRAFLTASAAADLGRWLLEQAGEVETLTSGVKVAGAKSVAERNADIDAADSDD